MAAQGFGRKPTRERRFCTAHSAPKLECYFTMKRCKEFTTGAAVLSALYFCLTPCRLSADDPVVCDGPCYNAAWSTGSCGCSSTSCGGPVLAVDAHWNCGGSGYLWCSCPSGNVGTSTPCVPVVNYYLLGYYDQLYQQCVALNQPNCYQYLNPCLWTTCQADPAHATPVQDGVLAGYGGTPCPPG